MAFMMLEALITNDEFKGCFAIPNKYGNKSPQWPHRTILLYRLTIIDGKINVRTGLWQRVNNIPNYPATENAKHAEQVMLENINKSIIFGRPLGISLTALNLEIISSYSPCQQCADMLIHFQAKLKNKCVNVHIDLQFANFYKDYPGCKDREINIKGITDLINNDIELRIFQGENDWKRFLMDASVDDVTKKECLKVAAEEGRLARETVDAMKIKKYNEDAEIERITAQFAQTTNLN